MGRRVEEIPLDTITRFEHAETPYPLPFLQHAWLGIAFWYPDQQQTQVDHNLDTKQHHIWFIKLPLDEQGLLQQAARDDFLQRLLQTFDGPKDKESPPVMPEDNPHGFTPRAERMAMFHARISCLLNKPPSQYFNHARDYFAGKTGYDQWNFVGLQGIADLVARLGEDNHAEIITRAMPQLPATPFTALCSCLENQQVDKKLTGVIATRIHEALHRQNPEQVAAGIRGISCSKDHNTVNATLLSVLKNSLGYNVEVLAAIAGRAWETLEDASVRIAFLEALARCEAGQQAFDGIMSDLLFMPGLGQIIRQEFRNTERSEQLARAFGAFLKAIQTNPHTRTT